MSMCEHTRSKRIVSWLYIFEIFVTIPRSIPRKIPTTRNKLNHTNTHILRILAYLFFFPPFANIFKGTVA